MDQTPGVPVAGDQEEGAEPAPDQTPGEPPSSSQGLPPKVAPLKATTVRPMDEKLALIMPSPAPSQSTTVEDVAAKAAGETPTRTRDEEVEPVEDHAAAEMVEDGPKNSTVRSVARSPFATPNARRVLSRHALRKTRVDMAYFSAISRLKLVVREPLRLSPT